MTESYSSDPEFSAAVEAENLLSTFSMQRLNQANLHSRMKAMYQGWLLAKKHATPPELTPTQNSNRSVLVAPYYWEPITPQTPQGVKMQVINKAHGVATYGHASGIWTHYAPLPQWRPKNAIDEH